MAFAVVLARKARSMDQDAVRSKKELKTGKKESQSDKKRSEISENTDKGKKEKKDKKKEKKEINFSMVKRNGLRITITTTKILFQIIQMPKNVKIVITSKLELWKDSVVDVVLMVKDMDHIAKIFLLLDRFNKNLITKKK